MKARCTWDHLGALPAIIDSTIVPSTRIGSLENSIIGASTLSSCSRGHHKIRHLQNFHYHQHTVYTVVCYIQSHFHDIIVSVLHSSALARMTVMTSLTLHLLFKLASSAGPPIMVLTFLLVGKSVSSSNFGDGFGRCGGASSVSHLSLQFQRNLSNWP